MPTYGHFIPYGHFPIQYSLYGHFIPYGHFPLWTLFHMDILPYGQFADSPFHSIPLTGGAIPGILKDLRTLVSYNLLQQVDFGLE